jgi:hypothetical protein
MRPRNRLLKRDSPDDLLNRREFLRFSAFWQDTRKMRAVTGNRPGWPTTGPQTRQTVLATWPSAMKSLNPLLLGARRCRQVRRFGLFKKERLLELMSTRDCPRPHQVLTG